MQLVSFRALSAQNIRKGAQTASHFLGERDS
jgi:hypothetical protein